MGATKSHCSNYVMNKRGKQVAYFF